MSASRRVRPCSVVNQGSLSLIVLRATQTICAFGAEKGTLLGIVALRWCDDSFLMLGASYQR